MSTQKTIKSPITLTGVGIHTGLENQITLCPSSVDSGIVFIREGKRLNANAETIAHTERATALSENGVTVRTPEHLMAALAGHGITNIEIECRTEEIPILDGSSLVFYEAIESAGIQDQGVICPPITIENPILIEDGTTLVAALPSDKQTLIYQLHYDNFIGTQRISYHGDFKTTLAPARTYGFYEEIKGLLERGLGQGGSLDNAVVIKEEGYMNDLRFPDELGRHKCLDLLGDLWLLGRPLNATIIGIGSGHRHTMALVKEVAKKIGPGAF